MPQEIGRYYALYFADASTAVEYCNQLVPHVVAHSRTNQRERPAVWFYMPQPGASTRGQRGAYLFLSPTAVTAPTLSRLAVSAGQAIARDALPLEAVLVLGEDSLQRLGAVTTRRVAPAVAIPPSAAGVTAPASASGRQEIVAA
jgi:hypothetical protein